MENGRLAFLRPISGLGATYGVRLRLIGKRVVDFLLLLIDFFARCYCRGATCEYRFNRRFRSNGDRLTQNFR